MGSKRKGQNKRKGNRSKSKSTLSVRNTPTKNAALYYELVAESLGQHPAIPDSPGDIFFAVQAGADIPAEVLQIQGVLEETAYTIRQLYESKQPKLHRRLFDELLSAAKLLAGPTPNPVVVASALERLQARILSREGSNKKRQYLNALGRRILVAIGLIFALVFAARLPLVSLFVGSSVLAVVPYYGVMFASACAAMWLSFASRLPSFSFDDLLEPDGEMLSSRHRIIYVMLFTGVLAIFAEAELVGIISIGAFSTDKIASEFISAVIFGFACGFSEKLLASTVAPHVTQIIGRLGTSKKSES